MIELGQHYDVDRQNPTQNNGHQDCTWADSVIEGNRSAWCAPACLTGRFRSFYLHVRNARPLGFLGSTQQSSLQDDRIVGSGSLAMLKRSPEGRAEST